MNKAALTILGTLFVSSASAVQAPTNWVVSGYEKFKDPPENRQRAPWITKEDISKTVDVKAEPTAVSKTIKKTGNVEEKPAPSAVSKALLGIGTACAVAAVGGKVLGEAETRRSWERAIVVAAKKPIVLVKTPIEGEGASIPNEVFNLVKAIVGVGVLSLPAGVAAFGSAPSAFVPAGILMAIIGTLSGYGFSIIGRVCAYTGAKSYREAWIRSIGAGTSWIPAWSSTFTTFLACLAYSMVLGDAFSNLLDTERNATLFAFTLIVLTPLCLMKDLKSMAPFSLLGVLGMVFTAVAMTIRYLDGTYSVVGESVGGLLGEVPGYLRPKFGNQGIASVFSPNSLILICMLSTSFMAHFNAPIFYRELKTNTIERYNTVVSWGFGLATLLMGCISLVGFLTFGKACDGLVLNNYAANDVWISFSRVAVAISLVFSYPLAFAGCRDGFLDLAQIPSESRNTAVVNLISISLLGMVTVMACTFSDVSFVLAFGGATLGNALTYIYPALMYRSVVRLQRRQGEGLGVSIAMGSAVVGIIMALIGGTMALKSLE